MKTVEELKQQIERAQASVQAAAEHHREEYARLFTSAGGKDGVRKYSDEEHARRVDELKQGLRRAEREANEAIGAARGEFEQLQAAAGHDVPFENFYGGAMDAFLSQSFNLKAGFDRGDAFNVRREFIKEDANDLSLVKLAGAVNAAALRGDPIEQALYARYAGRRAEREAPARLVAGERAPQPPPGLTALQGALGKLPQRGGALDGADFNRVADDAQRSVKALHDSTAAGGHPTTNPVQAMIETDFIPRG